MKKKKIFGIIIGIFAICLCVFIIGFIQEKTQTEDNFSGIFHDQESWTFSGGHLNLFSSLIGNITVNSSVIPESPRDIRIYRGYFREGDLVENITGPLMREVHYPISKDQAYHNAIRILESYGGLPSDAQLQYNSIQYGEIHNRTTGEIIRKINEGNFVSWYRDLDGMEIEGGSDIIQVEMGENGTLVHLNKRWRTYESLGNVSIISANKAIEKLAAKEVLNPISAQVSDVEIYNIHLSYYIQGIDKPEVTLEPIWVFYGNASGTGVPFFVYARQFANFTATPTSGKAPLTVNFTDMSDASPNRWYWNFGDGTNSTERNPAHTYTTAGTYNVSLRAWNDLGSDTMEVPFLVTVRDMAPPVANFTGSPATGPAPLTVSFNDTSSNLPTGWLWKFGDGTNATEQNPVHTYPSPGNYSVSLNATNDDGTGSVVKPDYITVMDIPPTTVTTQPTTTVTTAVTTTVTTIPTTTATTTPTPTKTQAPLSAVVPVAGVLIIGLCGALRREKDR